MGFIKGYNDGANITILNTIYHKPKKQEDGKYSKDSIDIVFKDLDTNEKKVQHIENPNYTYYMVNEGVPVDYNKLFISKKDVHPIVCKYTDIKKSIAENTNNLDFFYENLKNGNYKLNDNLFKIPSIFNADMNIEDYYMWLFDRTYKNEPFTPEKLYFDIEVDTKEIDGAFPEPGQCPINAVTIVDETHKKIYTLLLENYNNPLIEDFKKTPNLTTELKNFVIENIGGYKEAVRYDVINYDFKIVFYNEEIKLIVDFFNIINILKPDFALAWNIAFDLPYFIARIYTLGYDPRDIVCHKDFKIKEADYYIDKRADKFEERGDASQISSYTIYLDQLITFASRRKGQRAIANFKLDYVGTVIAGVKKLDYSHITKRLMELPYKDYKVFVFYNVMDTIVQLCVEKKVSDIDFVLNKSLSTNTRISKVHRQTTYLINRGIKDFWNMGYIMGNNVNKGNEKLGFVGAYVADPTLVSDNPKLKINGKSILVCDNNVDFDYKALYPSIIDENNMAPNTQRGKILFPEQMDPKENRYNNDTFDRTVWFIEDLNSKDYLNFCQRYLNLASYEEMYDDVIEFFTNVKRSIGHLPSFDSISGKRNMFYIVPENQKKEMFYIVDNSKKRDMVRLIERMPKNDN